MGGIPLREVLVEETDTSLPEGINFDRMSWPHGDSGAARVHGALFGQ